MVVQKTIDNLKDRPKDEKKAVASGVAIGVVVILLVGWGFMFVKKMQRGSQLEISSGRQAEFDFESVREAQKQLKENFDFTADELRSIRDSAASGQVQLQNIEVSPSDERGDQFGSPEDASF